MMLRQHFDRYYLRMYKETTSDPILKAAPHGYIKTADGVKLRYGHWEASGAKCRGSILFLTGRSEFMEKYGETIHELTSRQFDVFSFDWRGQGLSDRAISDYRKGYVKHYSEYLTDLHQIVENTVLPQVHYPLHLLGHSMGGHLALRYLAEYGGDRFDKIVLSAPMFDIQTDPMPAVMARRLCRNMTRLGLDRMAVPGSRHNPYAGRFKNNRLTSDPVRFHRTIAMAKANPHLAAGGVTFGWLDATFKSIAHLNIADLSRLTMPMLVVMAGSDRVVSNDATEKIIARLANSRSVTVEAAQHEILQERNELQHHFWVSFDEFMSS